MYSSHSCRHISHVRCFKTRLSRLPRIGCRALRVVVCLIEVFLERPLEPDGPLPSEVLEEEEPRGRSSVFEVHLVFELKSWRHDMS